MSSAHDTGPQTRAVTALNSPDSSVRLQAALYLGTYPSSVCVEPLITRCGVEPDFFVRDMLTWALTRHRADHVVPILLEELNAEAAQRRSQALHTLSKVRDRRGWAAITPRLLGDEDDEVARSAWRAAVVLVPDSQRSELARMLTGQLGRGGIDLRLSLSRALIALGPTVEDLLVTAMRDADPEVRAHARATERLRQDPESEFVIALQDADRVRNLGPERG